MSMSDFPGKSALATCGDPMTITLRIRSRSAAVNSFQSDRDEGVRCRPRMGGETEGGIAPVSLPAPWRSPSC